MGLMVHDQEPGWLSGFVWKSLWKVVAVGAVATLGTIAVIDLRHVLGILIIAVFFALAILPGVESLTTRFEMRRGAAVGLIFLAAAVVLVLMVAFLIPAIVQFAALVDARLSGWMADLDEVAGGVIDGDVAVDATTPLLDVAQQWGDNVFGALSSGLGLVFDVFTVLTFTFYIAADFPRLMRAIMRRLPPERQKTVGWVVRTSIQQTGGYFYSRLLLMLICGAGALFVMLVTGLPLVYALPLALFMGFTSEFIPLVGTYLGAIIPVLVVLASEGLGPAAVLLGYVIVYQQIENYVLSPRLSSKTMELNGAVAFGSAIVGGALAGPMGAFMALPVAALLTATAKNSGRTYDVVDGAEGQVEPGARPAPG